MRRIIALLCVLNASAVFAVEDTPENRLREADRYIATTPPKELFADMAEQMAKTAPPEQRKIIRDAFTKHLDVDALTKAMRDSLVRTFTVDELAALADFYGSVVGKSAMKKFGTYMADVMPALQGEMVKVTAKINRELPDPPEEKKANP